MSERAERYGDWLHVHKNEQSERMPPTFHALGKTRHKRPRVKTYGEILDRQLKPKLAVMMARLEEVYQELISKKE